MNAVSKSKQELKREIDELKIKLAESEKTLKAVRTGAVDAPVVTRDVTERKHTEEALAAAHRQTQEIIDNTTSVIYAFDPEERFVMANAAVAKLLNSTPELMIGKRRHEFMPKVDADRHEANDRRVFEAGKAMEFEEYGQLDDRSITWLTTKFPLRDMQGLIYAVAGISTDISYRKRAEEALRESEERYRHLLKHAPAGIYQIDFTTGRFLEVNDFMCRILGYSREELLAMTAADILDDEGKARFRERIKNARVGDPPDESVEYLVLTKDGRLIWGLLNTRFLWENGRIVRAMVVAHDISDRRMMELALKASEERLRLVLDTSMDGIVCFNYKTGVFDYVSPAVSRLLGYPMEELINWDTAKVHATIHPDDRPATLAAIKAMEKTGETTAEYREKRKDGTYVWLSNHMSLVRDDNGRPLYRNGCIRDITERKRAEAKLLAANRELTKFNQIMVGREIRMAELKKEINALLKELGRPAFYDAGSTAG